MLCSSIKLLTCIQKNFLKTVTVSHIHPKLYSAKPTSQVETTPEGVPKKKTKKPAIPKVTLITSDDNITVTTLEEAHKLSKRRDLKLVKINDLDTKTQRPVYKLMTGAQYFSEDLKDREEKKNQRQKQSIKGEKLLMLNQNISEHDLKVHVGKILKWIAKRYEVRITINGSSNQQGQLETIYNFLEDNLKDHSRLVQKRFAGNDCKFQVIPPKLEKESL